MLSNHSVHANPDKSRAKRRWETKSPKQQAVSGFSSYGYKALS